MPEYQTRKVEEGTEITVHTEEEIALVVNNGEEERIFLPPFEPSQDTYYVEPENKMVETAEGYHILYPGKPDSVELFHRS